MWALVIPYKPIEPPSAKLQTGHIIQIVDNSSHFDRQVVPKAEFLLLIFSYCRHLESRSRETAKTGDECGKQGAGHYRGPNSGYSRRADTKPWSGRSGRPEAD
jgi:hypothetical protein